MYDVSDGSVLLVDLQVTYEEEKIVLRGINAFVTNKEVWENTKTKERKVTFATKVRLCTNRTSPTVMVQQTGSGEWHALTCHLSL